jgi:hypothetical protein
MAKRVRRGSDKTGIVRLLEIIDPRLADSFLTDAVSD